MSFRLRKSDCDTLACLAEHRILTSLQFVAMCQKNKQVVRRRLGDLEREGLVQSSRRELGRARGRPEHILWLTERGIDILKDRAMIDRNVSYETVDGASIRCIDHQLLLNWFRIHLGQVERMVPQLAVKVLAYNSPSPTGQHYGQVFIADRSPARGSGKQEVRFTPDAVISTSDSATGKTCLFFLEVDCGTETIASPKRDMTDIRQKIANYGAYFDSGRYKRYEEVFKCSLRGFRVMFLANGPGRLATLCRLVREMPSTDFVWLTEYGRMFAHGVSADIWARGGNLRAPQQSILGSLSCQAPLPESCISRFSSTPL